MRHDSLFDIVAQVDYLDAQRFPHRFYRRSGAVPPLGFVGAVIIACAGSTVVAIAYSLITYINPIVFIGFLGTMAFGFLIGMAARFASGWGKIRNSLVYFVVGVIAALFAEWVSWVTFLYTLTEGSIPLNILVTEPGAMWELIQLVNDKGYYSLNNHRVIDDWLTAFWVIEFILVVGIAGITAATKDDAFCEVTGDWTDEKTNVLRVARTADLPEALIAEHYELLDQAKALAPDHQPAWRIDISLAPDARGSAYLTLVSIQVGRNSKGENELREDTTLRHLIVPRQVAERVLSRAEAKT